MGKHIQVFFISAIFAKSNFGQRIQKGEFNLPPPKKLPLSDVELPHVLLGDEAFALHENVMKPFPKKQSLADQAKRIYNFRHCHARRTVENAFGILAAYFRIFNTPIQIDIKTIDNLILSGCLLHNILRKSKVPTPVQCDYSAVNTNLISMSTQPACRARPNAIEIRNKFKDYFNGQGEVEWQNAEILSQI